MQDVLNKAKKIKLLLLDVDGVLTDGKIYITDQGHEFKAFNSQDGVGIKSLQKVNVIVGVITGRNSLMVEKRMAELGVTCVYQNQEDKLKIYQKIKIEENLEDENVAVMGDDLPDLPAMQQAGLAMTVPNACTIIKQYADWTTTRHGGFGAVREACELIILAKTIC